MSKWNTEVGLKSEADPVEVARCNLVPAFCGPVGVAIVTIFML